MAEFCKACSISVFGEDFRDFAGLADSDYQLSGMPDGTEATCSLLAKRSLARVVCERCGPTVVDSEGNCAFTWCWMEGEPGHGVTQDAKHKNTTILPP
jgi:hypothetical protein